MPAGRTDPACTATCLRGAQTGVGLEVLIAVVVLSIGFLGMAALQARALANNNSAMMHTQVTVPSYSILDAMRADRANALAGGYNTIATYDGVDGNGNSQCTLSPTLSGLADSQVDTWCTGAGGTSPDGLASRGFTKQTAGDMTGKSGWYMDLTSPVNGAEGERMVTPNQFQGNQLIGTSRIPDASDVCNPSGRGWIMALDPFTGTNVGEPFFNLNGDGVVDIADVITDDNGESYPAGGVGFDSPPNNPIFVGNTMLVSFENGTTASIETSGSTGTGGRISWRELVNP
ncbi:MAG: type IV pilus modification protein PilV [Chromatiaceae bacterium]